MARQAGSLCTICVALACLAPAPRPASAQTLIWKSRGTFYGDNTEFFNPYRTGQTILGAQMQTWLSAAPGPRTEIVLGVYGDHRSGRSDFFDEVKPLLGFRGSILPRSRAGQTRGAAPTCEHPSALGGGWSCSPSSGGDATFSRRRATTATTPGEPTRSTTRRAAAIRSTERPAS